MVRIVTWTSTCFLRKLDLLLWLFMHIKITVVSSLKIKLHKVHNLCVQLWMMLLRVTFWCYLVMELRLTFMFFLIQQMMTLPADSVSKYVDAKTF
uniref:Uncharacterized protein n=1 Tax=Arundo donax TaxID=35708 RepID=A0A0A9H2V6_ARUDO